MEDAAPAVAPAEPAETAFDDDEPLETASWPAGASPPDPVAGELVLVTRHVDARCRDDPLDTTPVSPAELDATPVAPAALVFAETPTFVPPTVADVPVLLVAPAAPAVEPVEHPVPVVDALEGAG